jgi:hypothetical protein
MTSVNVVQKAAGFMLLDPPVGLAQVPMPRALFRMLDRNTQMAQAKPELIAKFGSTLFPHRRSGKYHTVKNAENRAPVEILVGGGVARIRAKPQSRCILLAGKGLAPGG